MKKIHNVLTGIVGVVLSISMSGCSIQDGSSVYMNYGTGLGDDMQYNSELYGLNCSNDIEGADPGCFYVSEEEDEEYGGYYYMYKGGSVSESGASLVKEYYEENGILDIAYICFRSKDLHSWELAGVMDGGYSLVIDKQDWCRTCFWAPEVIRNEADGKYYMYFSASADQNWGVSEISSSNNQFDRLYLGVAVSDAPTGPFDILYDTDSATGKRIPTINFKTGCGTEYNWAAIDVSPFFDDDGQLYLYFNKHTDDHYDAMMGVWGMKMKSMAEPDYTTVSYLAAPGKVTASNTPGNIEEISSEGAYFDPSETNVNEAPFMFKHKDKYYLTYASNGYGQVGYSVHQAVSEEPLSGFKKLSMEQGNPVLNGSLLGYMNGTAHHALVRNGDDLWIVYHRHNSTTSFEAGWDRSICADRVNFVTNSDGLDVLTANGPSIALQWLPERVSGYRNLAKTAKISVSNGKGVEYLTDEVLPFYTVTQERVMSTEKNDVTITLTWDEPVSVSSVMVYDAYDVYKAFSKVAKMEFKLAERPKWAKQDYDYAVIEDLQLPDRYWDADTEKYIQCSPAVAEFDPIKITELKITINEEDRLISEDKLGDKVTALNLSEIVVLGGAD